MEREATATVTDKRDWPTIEEIGYLDLSAMPEDAMLVVHLPEFTPSMRAIEVMDAIKSTTGKRVMVLVGNIRITFPSPEMP